MIYHTAVSEKGPWFFWHLTRYITVGVKDEPDEKLDVTIKYDLQPRVFATRRGMQKEYDNWVNKKEQQ